jgi:CheY-like chemotaxis protein
MSHDRRRAEHDARGPTTCVANGKARLSVFVVEDDSDISQIMVTALRDEGYAVNCAQNGREALDALRAQADAPPGVIFLDLMMPFMDGREFRREQLRDPMLAAIPVVLFTADPKALRDAAAMQVDVILSKPATLEQILLVVERFCSAAGHRM